MTGGIKRLLALFRRLGLFGRIFTVVSFVSGIATIWVTTEMLIDRWSPGEASFDVATTPVHLGDNYRAFVGGDRSLRPYPTRCDSGLPDDVILICYDKRTKRFFPAGSAPDAALGYIRGVIHEAVGEANLGAYRHILATTAADLRPDEAARALSFDGGPKVWRENAGNYYTPQAAVLVASQFSLFEKLSNYEKPIEDVERIKFTFSAEVMSGGRRADQKDETYVFLGDQVQPVVFPSLQTRDTRVLNFEFELAGEQISRMKPILFGFYVLPWQEAAPIPPEGVGTDPRGPAHFQDVDVNFVHAKLEIY